MLLHRATSKRQAFRTFGLVAATYCCSTASTTSSSSRTLFAARHRCNKVFFTNRAWTGRIPNSVGEVENIRPPIHSTAAPNTFIHRCLQTKSNNFDDDEPEDARKVSDYFTPADRIVESQTLDWIRKVVIRLNLCPFADKSLRDQKLQISIVRGKDDESIASAVIYELISRSERPGTTVVVAPEYYPDDFEAYLSMLQLIEDVVDRNDELKGVVQIAPFHPLFEFEGSGPDGVDNYTNRSPYPLFHVLREDEVSAAAQKLGGDASVVWERNIELLKKIERKLGREGVQRVINGEQSQDLDDILKEMKNVSI